MSIAKNTKETFLEEIVDNLNGNTRDLPVDCKPRTREEVLLAEIEKNTRELNNTNEVEIDLSDYYTKSETDNLVKTNVKTMLDDSLNSNTTTWSSNKIIEYVDESNNPIFGESEDTYISVTDSIDGAIQDIEIKGNTVQDPDNLSDIKSVGELQEDGTYKMSILSCGKNLFDGELEQGTYSYDGSIKTSIDGEVRNVNPIYVKGGSTICFTSNTSVGILVWEYNSLGVCELKTPSEVNMNVGFKLRENTKYINFRLGTNDENVVLQLEEGTVATPYEPYQGNKCDILLPCQLEKVGDVADRIVCKDGVWGVEKNVASEELDTSLLRLVSSQVLENTNYYTSSQIDTKANDTIKVILCNKLVKKAIWNVIT